MEPLARFGSGHQGVQARWSAPEKSRAATVREDRWLSTARAATCSRADLAAWRLNNATA